MSVHSGIFYMKSAVQHWTKIFVLCSNIYTCTYICFHAEIINYRLENLIEILIVARSVRRRRLRWRGRETWPISRTSGGTRRTPSSGTRCIWSAPWGTRRWAKLIVVVLGRAFLGDMSPIRGGSTPFRLTKNLLFHAQNIQHVIVQEKFFINIKIFVLLPQLCLQVLIKYV